MMKFAFVILAGLIALALGSANSTSSMSNLAPKPANVQTVLGDPIELEVVEETQPLVEDGLVLQPPPAAPAEPAKEAQPETGSPSDRLLPPPAVSGEVKCGSEPTCCARKVRCCRRVARCRSGCGLFRRR